MTKAELGSGSLRASIAMTEAGKYVGSDPNNLSVRVAWTGTGPNGRRTSNICNDWRDDTPDSAYEGGGGMADFASLWWTGGGGFDYPCAYTFALYCFED
jgi:hypothetical protein